MAQFLRHTRKGQYRPQGGRPRERRTTLASASIVGRAQIRRTVTAADWQAELWGHFDTVGELRYAVRWLANAVSRCNLYIGEIAEEFADPTPVEDNPEADTARQLLDSLHYGQLGQAEMLRRIALHLSVPGETFLVGLEARPDDGIPEPRWYVASSDEITVSARGESRFTLPETGRSIQLDPDNSTIIRMWLPHPRRGWEPDSPVRATIPALREIKGLSDHIAASVDSRLAGAGVLAIPHSASAPAPQSSDASRAEPLHNDEFVNSLMEAMLTSIQDRDDASAVVPVVIKVPDEAVGKIQHITFATELSSNASNLRKDAINRFAGGADLPAEVVTGTASANHWGAWQLEESSIKLHVEPLVAVICDALTQQYLWPALRAAGDPNPKRWVIWYNPSELTQRPNKASEAQALYDKGALSLEALLRENGFSDEDAPSDAERAQWMAMRIALSNPDLLPSLQHLIGPSTPTPEPDDSADTTNNSGQLGPPTEESSNASMPPALRSSASQAGWWLRTVEQVALRALELAGKRLLSRSQRDWKSAARNVHPWDIHTVVETRPTGVHIDRLLDGAYDTATVNFADDPCVLNAVDAYCRHLLTHGQPHRREYLATTLAERGCTPTQFREAA